MDRGRGQEGDTVTSAPFDKPEDAVAASRRRTQREAINDLGAALRALVESAVATEVSPEDLLQAADLARKANELLTGRQRTRDQLSSADDLLAGVRMYNPVSGLGSPLAPPVRMELLDGVATGTCTLGLAFEGPPRYAHGGVSAMLLDQMLGYATSSAGHPGMTVHLATRYRAPVPLQTPLRLWAELTEVNGRKMTVTGNIATAADPDTILVEAIGTFVALQPAQAQRLFGPVLPPGTVGPAVAHD
jgi:acyl-coenzyme A thioesterase PaaI-like protein